MVFLLNTHVYLAMLDHDLDAGSIRARPGHHRKTMVDGGRRWSAKNGTGHPPGAFWATNCLVGLCGLLTLIFGGVWDLGSCGHENQGKSVF